MNRKSQKKAKNLLFVSNKYESVESIALVLNILIIINLANTVLCNHIPYSNDTKVEPQKHGLTTTEDGNSDLIWSDLLEDYILSQTSGNRKSKDVNFMNSYEMTQGPLGGMHMYQQGPLNYHSSNYKRPGQIFITKRIGEAAELEPHMRPPVEVVQPQFRPMTNQMLQQQQQQRQTPGFFQQIFGIFGEGQNGPPPSTPSGSHNPNYQHNRPIQMAQQTQHIQSIGSNGKPQNIRTVTENDLYLLGAIEKLVYRVDYLESRIKRAEQLIYYLMAGNNQKEVKDPCPTNFTRISDNCYYINSQQQVNWKTANSACKALGAHLAEFEKASENEEIIAYLLNQQNHRGRDYWLGGLNPGLLWIWSNSAKPVNPNTNLTSIAMSHRNDSSNNSTESNLIEDDDDLLKKKNDSSNDAILNNTMEIQGYGRCLRLAYNSSRHTYTYYGQECTTRQNYICEMEDKTLDNKIKKITRDLKFFD